VNKQPGISLQFWSIKILSVNSALRAAGGGRGGVGEREKRKLDFSYTLYVHFIYEQDASTYVHTVHQAHILKFETEHDIIGEKIKTIDIFGGWGVYAE